MPIKNIAKRFWMLSVLSLAFVIASLLLFRWASAQDRDLDAASDFSQVVARMISLTDALSGELYRVESEARIGTDTHTYKKIVDDIRDDSGVLRAYFAQRDKEEVIGDVRVSPPFLKHQPEVADVLADARNAYEAAFTEITTFVEAARRHNPSMSLFQKINSNSQPSLLKVKNDLESIRTTTLGTLDGIAAKHARLKFIGLLVSLIFVALYVAHHIFRFTRLERIAEFTRSKNRVIMDKSNDGFMVIGPDMMVKNAHLKGLQDNLDDSKVVDYKFDDVMIKIIKPKDVKDFRVFQSHFFNETIGDPQFETMNNVKELVLTDDSGDEEFAQPKHLKLDFYRLRHNGKIAQILLRFTDISANHKIEELKDTQSKSDSLLSEIINVIFEDRSALFEPFLETTRDSIENINNLLKANSESGANKHDLKMTLNDIGREVASLSQNIRPIKLTSFEDLVVEFGSVVNTLKRDDKLTGNDFLPVAMKLDELITMQQYITNTVKKFEALHVIKR